tara:strand:- start:60 stop:515 length:456 start_codon:yes stop_codon:yes gene_type:complete
MWATPTTKGYGHASEGQVANLLKKVQNGKITMKEAEQMVGLQTLENHRTYKKMWPTPRVTGQENLDTLIKRKGLKKALQHNLTAAVQMWPTPRASEYKDTGPVGSKSHSHMQEKKYLCAAVKDPEQPLGMLNPQWVEWLMGYPEGWTDLKD